MSVEIEAAGAFVTAGLGAGEIERHGDTARAASAAPSVCPNCQAPSPARHCSNCGQASHLHNSLLHLGEEVLHGILHFDAKGWRTLPLLIARPGLLTRRYIDGQRTRYVSPLALFLFMIFLMFFVVSATSGSGSSQTTVSTEQGRARAHAEMKREVEHTSKALAVAQARLAAATGPGEERVEAGEQVADAQLELKIAQDSLAAFEKRKARADSQPVTNLNQTGFLKRNPTIRAAIKHAADNPELTAYKLKNTAYKFSFLLVPISLPFMWLLFFWRRRVKMYEHAVFSLYSISFMSLLFVVLAVLGAVGLEMLSAALLLLVPPLHMYAQLREAYALSGWAALWRTGALLCVTATVFLLYLALILVLTVS
jgi:hypothetical protein